MKSRNVGKKKQRNFWKQTKKRIKNGQTKMTKLQIISKLWSIIYDLLLLLKGSKRKTLEEIEKEMDIVESHCRKYEEEEL